MALLVVGEPGRPAGALPRQLASSTTIPGTMAVEQYPAGSCSAVGGTVALITASAGCLSTLRTDNPGATLLAYMKGELCSGSQCPSNPADPEYAHNPSGSRIPGSFEGTYLMQLDNSTWMNAVVSRCKGYAPPWDGCFLDMMGQASYLLSSAGIEVPNSNPPTTYTATAWAKLASTLYTFVQANVPTGTRLIANGLGSPACVVSPGCSTPTRPAYLSSGLIYSNTASTDYGAMMENFPCLSGLSQAQCITSSEVTNWRTAMTYDPTSAEHIQVIDHVGGSPVDHDTALALFLSSDVDPTHTWWAYCSNPEDSACQRADPEYVQFFNDALATGASTFQYLGATGGVYHTSWTNGNCYINTGSSAVQLTVPGTNGQPEVELNGAQDIAGQTVFSLKASGGMCWSGLPQAAAGPVSVTLAPPQVSGLSVTINGSATTKAPGASISSISWNWGRGQPTTSSFPATHTYNQPGTYPVQVTAFDTAGNQGSATTSVTINGGSNQQ
jgi:hypothetical protein